MCLVTQSCLTLCDPVDCSPTCSSVHRDSLGKNTGVGCHALLQEIFPTQGLNLGLPHCRQILYCLSHQVSPSILGWVAYPFSNGSSQPRNWIRVSCIAGGFFTSWTTCEAHVCVDIYKRTHTHIYVYISSLSGFPPAPSQHSRSPQSTGLSSLHYTAASH